MTTPTDTDIAALHRRTVEHFAQQVEALEADDWTRPTPCPAWNVRDLVNHVAVEDLWTVPLLDGRTVEEVGDALEGDQLGADPAATVRDAAAAAITAVERPGVLESTVHLSFGDAPASEYLWQLTADHLIHGWDLARAVEGDDRLDPEVVDACAVWFVDNEEFLRAAGAIGPRPPIEVHDAQGRLLVAFGREP